MYGNEKKNRVIWGIAAVCLAGLMVLAWNPVNPFHRGKTQIRAGVFSDSYWDVQNGNSYRILSDAISRFTQEHPEISVSFESGVIKDDYSEWLAEQIVKGSAPDIYFILSKDFNMLAETGALQPLTSLAEQDPQFDVSRYYETARGAGMINGELYALPYECAPKLMFVNKSILDRENIPMPKNDWTWQDFLEICRKVTKDTNGNGALDQFGVSGYGWKDAFDSNGVRLFDETGETCYFTSDGIDEALLFLEQLEGLSEGPKEEDADFAAGNTAFAPMLFSEYRAYKSEGLNIRKYSDFVWDCVAMPAGPQGSNCSELETLLVGMNPTSGNREMAWELMKTLTCDPQIQGEIFEYSEGISVLREVSGSDETKRRLTEQSGGEINANVMTYVMDHTTEQHFRNYEEAMAEAEKSVESILTEASSLRMGQIIQNRRLNQYLRGR